MTYNVLVLGAKPDALLPCVEPSYVYCANAAIALSIYYSDSRYSLSLNPPQKVQSVIGSGEFLDRAQIHRALRLSCPDVICLMGEKAENPVEFCSDIIGLNPVPQLVCYSFFERYMLLYRRVGLFAPFVGLGGLRKLKVALKDLLFKRSMHWCHSSTGLAALCLAMDQHPNANIIVSGIGLRKGGHFYGGSLQYSEIRSRSDRWLMRLWRRSSRPELLTTDPQFASLADVDLFSGNSIPLSSLPPIDLV
ncbi:hypothetical protein [Synechococcus sp. KORDI-49]|uniref:hypothetical protein n=1 Tax=Synechococcus sp. KORDI-49 TaxID=585423 RepID=UPI0012EBC1FD|nr:hypothetical protein [Synechococcus sp. KORDI-49]